MAAEPAGHRLATVAPGGALNPPATQPQVRLHKGRACSVPVCGGGSLHVHIHHHVCTGHLTHSLTPLNPLKTSLNPSESLEALSRLVEQPEWILTISHIFAHAHTAPLPLRQLAGLLVKNEAFAHLAAMNHDCQVQVKAHMLVALAAPQPALRSTAATLVAQYSAAFPLTHWTDLLAQIGSTVGTGAAGVAAAAAAAEVEAEAALHGAMSALHRICEDSLEKLFMEGEKAMLEALLGSVLHLLGHQDPTIALLAIQTFTSTLWMLDSRGRASRVGISTFLDAFVHGIGALANDPRPSIRVEVCKAVTELMSVHYKVLGPSLDPMCTFMLAKMTDASAGVVMEACEMFRILATKVQPT